MVKNIESIQLYSSDPDKLAGFYRDRLGLEVSFEGVMGEKEKPVYVFEFDKGTSLAIMYHDKVKGENKTPERLMVNFEVNDIEEAVEKMEKGNVKKVADIYHIEDYGYVATFADPDGNFFQLVKTSE